jgi:hypothetical protein
MTLTETAKALQNMDRENTLGSKVNGRRNYIIRVEDNCKIVFAGMMGEARRRGETAEYIRYIILHHVRWYEFTYKKDFKEALDKLKEMGYN